jgi:hypothetical protein
MEIPRNVGTVDRLIRLMVGAMLVLLTPFAFAGSTSSWAGSGSSGCRSS